MERDDSLTELIDLVKNIGKIYDDEGITINIDFDHNDGIIMVKYQNENSEKITCIINTNYKTINGIDTTKFWLPDYPKSQKANKKMIQLLERKGYSLSNITYRKK
ncbi:hypothetical protein LCGC14_2493690 [marine sediment metagenome]|uniref:Uncharacterized protein n=1 Tax=marine sediment metagenome TaxID=412755 RepID=A0A0F9DFT1_9ZZZZ